MIPVSRTPMWEVDQYAALIDKILKTGEKRKTRAGDTFSIFGETMTIDMYSTFPLLLGRKMFYKPVLGEMATFLQGPKNVADFQKNGCNYWNAWGNTDPHKADYGAINVDYGNAWRDFNGVDQLAEVVSSLVNNPTDRRMLVSGWRPDNLKSLDLPCCHLLYQWYVRDGKYLDMVWYQRSVDVMVGLPSDIILAAALNIILAESANLVPGTLKFMLGDTHIYSNHLPGVLDYLRSLQNVRDWTPARWSVDNNITIDNFTVDSINIHNYTNHEPAIKFELNV